MGQAREIMDRITAAVVAGDGEALGALYAEDAVLEGPDGRFEGRSAITEYLLSYKRAFPDMTWEAAALHETGDVAVDEGYAIGTHTGPLATPEGDLAPTGRSVRLRECDVLTVAAGRAVSHRFYFDQVEMATQLGQAGAEAPAVPAPRAGAEKAAQTPVS